MAIIKKSGVGDILSGTIDGVEHPDAICIASVTGYQEQYLTGEWPSVITLKALKGKDTLTIVVK